MDGWVDDLFVLFELLVGWSFLLILYSMTKCVWAFVRLRPPTIPLRSGMTNAWYFASVWIKQAFYMPPPPPAPPALEKNIFNQTQGGQSVPTCFKRGSIPLPNVDHPNAVVPLLASSRAGVLGFFLGGSDFFISVFFFFAPYGCSHRRHCSPGDGLDHQLAAGAGDAGVRPLYRRERRRPVEAHVEQRAGGSRFLRQGGRRGHRGDALGCARRWQQSTPIHPLSQKRWYSFQKHGASER